MIFTAFVSFASFILSIIVGILPAGSGFPPQIAAAFSTFGGYVQTLSTIFPVGTLFTVLVILFSVDIAIFGFKTFKWLISFVPFVGGRG